ncbi:MAG: hypothetical protein GKC03_05120 [Methanomassiliicoccales archaeon]|nr:hypothetical protein [Methanomassiliicoccales archaeon]NYT15410.1 hypothetical protein [Methanomassiliicoccales archaeon]
MGKYLFTGLAILTIALMVALSPLASSYGSYSGNQEYGATSCHEVESTVTVTMESNPTGGIISPNQPVRVWVNVTGEISGDELGALISSNTAEEGSLPTENGWTILTDPSGETQYNYYKDPEYDGEASFLWVLEAPMENDTYPIYSKVVHAGDTLYSKAAGPILFQVGEPVSEQVVVQILEPVHGSSVGDSIIITAIVTVPSWSDVTIESVNLIVDWELVTTKYENPYSWILDTKEYANGNHIIEVIAHDSMDAAHSATVNVTVNNLGDDDVLGNLGLNMTAGIMASLALVSLLTLLVLYARDRLRGGG